MLRLVAGPAMSKDTTGGRSHQGGGDGLADHRSTASTSTRVSCPGVPDDASFHRGGPIQRGRRGLRPVCAGETPPGPLG